MSQALIRGAGGGLITACGSHHTFGLFLYAPQAKRGFYLCKWLGGKSKEEDAVTCKN